MARIRTIKPEFWTSGQILECSRNARLLFIGLWNFCDDHGRHKFVPRQIKAEVYPGDDLSEDDILGMLHELSKNGLIRTYVVENSEYLQVTGWHHQRIDKPQKQKFPEPSENTPGTLPPRARGLGKEGKGKDSKGEELKHMSDLQSDVHVKNSKNEFSESFEQFWQAYPTDRLMSKLEALRAWQRLGEEDRTAAIAGVAGFAAHCRANPTYRPLHACRYLSQRRFDGFAAPPDVPQPPPGVHVRADTPQWDAWARHRGRSTPRDAANGWVFPSEWPPGHELETASNGHDPPASEQWH